MKDICVFQCFSSIGQKLTPCGRSVVALTLTHNFCCMLSSRVCPVSPSSLFRATLMFNVMSLFRLIFFRTKTDLRTDSLHPHYQIKDAVLCTGEKLCFRALREAALKDL